jgi:hypothetical protein
MLHPMEASGFVIAKVLQMWSERFENGRKLRQDRYSRLEVTGLSQFLHLSRNRPKRWLSHIGGCAFDRMRPHLHGGGIGASERLGQSCELAGHIFDKRCYYEPREIFVPHHPVHQLTSVETLLNDRALSEWR